MKKRFVVLVLAMLLAGCSDTTVYIPEDDSRLEAGQVVYIPMDEEKPSETEAVPTEPAPTEVKETEPEQKHTATVSKKTTSSSNKGTTTGNKNNTTNKETVTGSGKPAETQPAPTEGSGNSGQITVTGPVETEPPATEVPVTEPPATEPPATEPPATEAPETEPPETEVPETEPPATEIPETEPPTTEPPVTEPPETEPPLYDISDYVVGDLEYAMLDRINEYRMEAELEELWMDEYLCAIASCRAYESSLVWSHTRPDGRGYWTVLADYGYGGGASGELLGYSNGDGAAVVDKWMSSDAHRELLMGGSSAVGIGIYYSGGVIFVAVLLI